MKFSTLLLLSTFTSSNAFYQSHDIITHDDGSVHLFEKTQHRRLATKNLKSHDAVNTKFTVHGSEYVTQKLHVDGIATVGGLEFDDAGGWLLFLNSLAGQGITVDSGQLTVALGTTASTALAGSTPTISTAQSTAIADHTTEIATNAADIVTSNGAAAGALANAASNTASIATNTASIATNLGGINSNGATINSHSTAIVANAATAAAAAVSNAQLITTNTADIVTVTNAAGGALTNAASNTASIATNTASIATNTAKTGITSAQASEITANTAKTGITSAQASEITANTAKTGITTVQSDAIAANTAKLVLTAAADSGIAIDVAGAISARMDTGAIKDALDAVEAADTVTAVQKEYRLERMVLLLCNTLGIKYEHLVRAVDEGTFDPYGRFSAIQVNDDDLYSTNSNNKLVDVTTATAAALCSTYTNYASACASGYSNKHDLAMCATGTCASSDFTASGLCCVPN